MDPPNNFLDENSPLLESQEPRNHQSTGETITLNAGEHEPPRANDETTDTELSPPPYQDGLELKASTPTATQRYDKTQLPQYPRHVAIPPTYFSMMPPAIPAPPEGWLEFVHPEGQNYFYCPSRRIVTEANLRDVEIFQLIYQAASRVDGLVAGQQLTLSPSTELLLELGNGNQVSTECRYYFVDHMRRTIFWLEHTATDTLDLPPVSSMTHLKHLFMQHYWSHIEYFPMHIAMPSSVEEELIAILSHACVDFMTTDLSTVPYNQEQCESFIKIIQRMPESQRADGFRNCVMARLWSEICGNYFVNMHGETHARMSRNQRLLPEPVISTPWTIKALNTVLLGTQSFYLKKLDDLWIDRISYAAYWRVFNAEMVTEWRRTATMAALLLFSALTMLFLSFRMDHALPIVTSFMQALSIVSIVACLSSMSSGLLLARAQQKHAVAHASEAVEYLEAKYSEEYGMQLLAIQYAVPWASLLWGSISFMLNVVAVSFSLPELALRIVIWIAFGASFFGAVIFGMFLSIGTSSLSMLRLRVYFTKPDLRLFGSSGILMRLIRTIRGLRRRDIETGAP